MIDKVLRPPKERALTPLASRMASYIHPNSVTVIACVVGLASAVAAWQHAFGVALALWVLNRVLDGLDGTLARVADQQSDVGGYLDIVLDNIVYAAVPLGVALALDTRAAYLGVALLFASFYINNASWMYLAALLEKRNVGAQARGELTTIAMPGGLIEGTETIVLYGLLLLVPGASVPLFMIMGVLVLCTAAQRLIWAVRALR